MGLGLQHALLPEIAKRKSEKKRQKTPLLRKRLEWLLRCKRSKWPKRPENRCV